jgi:hypothetical protein
MLIKLLTKIQYINKTDFIVLQEWEFKIQDYQSLSVRDYYSTINIQKNSILNNFITEYIRNVDRAIPNTVLENTVRRVNKCVETGRGHFEHYM